MPSQIRIHVCLGVHCTANGSPATLQAFERAVADRGLQEEVEIIATSCRDRCDYGPSVNVYPGFHTYCQVRSEHAANIIEDRLQGGAKAVPLLCKPHMRRS